MSIARVKIGRIRPKVGNLALFNTGCTAERLQINQVIRDQLDAHMLTLSGIAIVSWDVGGGWMADVVNFDTSPLLRMDVPQFAAKRLSQQVGEDLTIDRVRRMLGWD